MAIRHKLRKLLASARSSAASLIVLAVIERSTNRLQSSEKNWSTKQKPPLSQTTTNLLVLRHPKRRNTERLQIPRNLGIFGTCAMQLSPGSLFRHNIIREPGYEAGDKAVVCDMSIITCTGKIACLVDCP